MNGNAPTAAKAVFSAAVPPQSSFRVTSAGGFTLVLKSNADGSGRKPVTLSWPSEGPPARARIGLLPLVPAPPITVPMVIVSPARRCARIDRFVRRPGLFVPGTTVSVAPLLVAEPELFLTITVYV